MPLNVFQVVKRSHFVTSSQSSVFVQNPKGPWPPEKEERVGVGWWGGGGPDRDTDMEL